MKDGWRTVLGREAYVENGKIKRFVDKDKTLYVWRYNHKYGGWDREYEITPAAFYAGMSRGTIMVK